MFDGITSLSTLTKSEPPHSNICPRVIDDTFTSTASVINAAGGISKLELLCRLVITRLSLKDNCVTLSLGSNATIVPKLIASNKSPSIALIATISGLISETT